jgi:large subunit ribosomal protein L21
MSDYAVVKVQGSQYRVSAGDEILVDKLKDDNVQAEVLLMVKGSDVLLGKPYLKDTTLKIKVLQKEEQGKKIHVSKYKSKSRYRRKIGFRPVYTRLLIEKLS